MSNRIYYFISDAGDGGPAVVGRRGGDGHRTRGEREDQGEGHRGGGCQSRVRAVRRQPADTHRPHLRRAARDPRAQVHHLRRLLGRHAHTLRRRGGYRQSRSGFGTAGRVFVGGRRLLNEPLVARSALVDQAARLHMYNYYF